MFLIYTDESGNTGHKKDPDQPIHMIGALIVRAEQVRPINEAIVAILKHFALKTSVEEVEIHGVEIFAGKGPFRGVSVDDRIQLVDSLLAVIGNHDVHVGFGAVDKILSGASTHPHQIAFGLVAERLQDWLKEQDALGLIIADENHEVQQPVIRAMRKFQTVGWGFGGQGKPMSQIIDTVHFVRSVDNRVLQLADLATYVLCKAQRVKDTYRKERRELKPSEELLNRMDMTVRNRLIFSRVFPRWE